MTFVDHVLLPTDGSEGALHAAAFAGELARALGAKVTVIHILSNDYLISHAWGGDVFIAGGVGSLKSVEEVRSGLEQRAHDEELRNTVEALGDTPHKPELVTVWGHAADEITHFAKDNEVGLIVIGSYGKSKLKRAFLGSVSQAVANQAPCPITIVK